MADLEQKPNPEPIPNMNFAQLRQAFQNIGVKVTKRSIQSYDYVANTSGWKIDANGNVEFNDGTFRGVLLIGALLGARVEISGNDIVLYDNSTGGGGTISGDTASVRFKRTDGHTGEFFIQKRHSKNNDLGNVFEMFYNEDAESEYNYIFIGRKGNDNHSSSIYNDEIVLHGSGSVRAEVNRVHFFNGRPTIYTYDYNKVDASKEGVATLILGEGRDGFAGIGFVIEGFVFSGATSFAVGDTITGNVSGATALLTYKISSSIFLANHTSYGVDFSVSDNACTTDGVGGGSGTGAWTDPTSTLGGQFLNWYSLSVDKSLNVILGNNMFPDTDNAYDIGSTTKRIKDLHVAGGIYEGTTSYTAGHAITAGNAVYVSNGTTGSQQIAVQTNDTGPLNLGTNGDQQRGMSFSYGTDVYIKSMAIVLGIINAPTDDLQLSLQADNAGVPSGTNLATTAAVNVTGTAEWTFTFSTPQKLTANTTYWFVLQRTGAVSDINYYFVEYTNNSPVNDISSYNGSSWYSTISADYVYKLYELLPSGYIGVASQATTGRFENFVGFALNTVATDGTVRIKKTGIMTLSGLTIGQTYLANSGGVSSSPGATNTRKVGIALSATELLITNIW